MTKENARNIKLGIFVVAGTLLLITAFYLMGKNQNLFGSKLRISATFYDVGGLMKGNNVRFAGIDVGTVESVEIMNDTSVRVTMVIQKDVQKFIRKNSIAMVGTDGLMGNRLINIQAGGGSSVGVEEGDELVTLHSVEMDQMVRKLDVTNQNVMVISGNLRSMTDKLSSPNSFWNVLLDTIVAQNVKTTVVNLKLMSNDGVALTGDFKKFTQDIKDGKGSLGALITDTTVAGNIRQSVVNLKLVSDSAAIITGDVAALVRNLKAGEGSLGILLNDTMLVHNLNKGILSLDTGAVNFNQNMEAAKYSWPFKKYYRKKGGRK